MAASLQSGHDHAFAVELAIDISAVEQARLALNGYLKQIALDAMTVNRIEVILEEIVSNVVRHGRGCDFVRISASNPPGAIELVFEDNGEPFNPLDAEEPDEFTTVEEARLGGQGIPLVRRLSKSVEYDRTGDINRVVSIVALT